ncbi:4-hydroxythreonine-4-phosphate dehydrogenase PdxA [Pseudoroseicyclus sp. CXY001]|uniref:4-hydroxythreonine-4-phosphate dehydrogenase PdxA n=1 Tax=Pseudoroseicyclus sp. CXY001 TaxID=3242492 RepID=UPI00358DD54B
MRIPPPVVSCGEPAGVGPEVAAKAWDALRGELPFAWIGDPSHLPAGTPWDEIRAPAEAQAVAERALPVLFLPFERPAIPGVPQKSHAEAVIEAIRYGADLAASGAASALVTGPISKAALMSGAGFAFPGHTEFLAHLAGDVPVAMMLACSELRVVPATIHVALSEVPKVLTPARLEEVIRLTHAGLRRDFGITGPRLAVAGLNPHAGEDGRMGREEQDWISPLLLSLRAEGLSLTGPHPADTLFHAAARARYDAAIAMYHDQALIPIKTIDFAGGVNVTLGLPFIRTSPDHGTAFDIAGRNRADPTSMIAALRMASDMAARKARAPA